MKRQLLFNVFLCASMIVLLVISLVCFTEVYSLYLNGSLKLYYRTQILNGNINNLHWDYGRGDAPAVGGDKLNGYTAYIYNLSDKQCDVIIVSERNLYGENISIEHFDSDDIEKAQISSKQQLSFVSLLSKEVSEYSKLSSSNLIKSEKLFRNCCYIFLLLCIVLITENILYFVVKKAKANVS